MRKKIFFSIIFILLSSAVFLFTANEYLKMVEKNAIETYLNTLKNESSDYALNVTSSEISCIGFIKHKCSLKEINIQNQIKLENTTIAITELNSEHIGVDIRIGKITHNNTKNPYSIFIPNKFSYSLRLTKEDSKLGYVLLDRRIEASLDKFSIDAKLSVLIRDPLFRNKHILFLLKEWFDTTTPSFYEYSLKYFALNLQAQNVASFYREYFNNFNKRLLDVMADTKHSFKKGDFQSPLTNMIFDDLLKAVHDLLNGEVNSIALEVKPKNERLVFFNTLSKDASIKKVLEIEQILDSINETHRYKLDIK